jgi:hypothetical protein
MIDVADEEREAATGQARGCLHCGGRRFESPPLHQEGGANGPGFATPNLDMRLSPLPRPTAVEKFSLLFRSSRKKTFKISSVGDVARQTGRNWALICDCDSDGFVMARS